MDPLQPDASLLDSHNPVEPSEKEIPTLAPNDWTPIFDKWEAETDVRFNHFQTDGYSYLKVHDISPEFHVQCRQLRDVATTNAFFSRRRDTKGSTRIM